MPHFAAWAAAAGPGEREASRQAIIVHERNRVCAGSPALRERGLVPGMSLPRARMLFPQARFVPRDLPAEEAYAEELCARLYPLTPQLARQEAPWLPGFWVVLQGLDPAAFQAVLPAWHAQGGWARFPAHAMLAALCAPPGQLRLLATPAAFFRTAAVQRLAEVGISPRTLALLHWCGVRTLADLQRLTRPQLQAQFGTEGSRLFAWLHPAPHPPQIPAYMPRSLTVACTCCWTPGTVLDFHPWLGALVRAADERRPAGFVPTWIRLAVTQRGAGGVARVRALKPPYAGTATLQGPATYLLTQALAALPAPVPVTRLALTVGGLRRAVPVQESLFRRRPSWETVRQHLVRRFPQRLFRPRRTTDAPFLPEEEFSLAALDE